MPKLHCGFSNKMSTDHSLGWPPSGGSRKSMRQPKEAMCVEKHIGENANLVGTITRNQTQRLSNDTTANFRRTNISENTLNTLTVSLNTETGDCSEGNKQRSLYRKEATLGDILQNRAGCPPNLLKKRLLNELNWEKKCSSCRLTKWLGDPIALKLNHMDSDTNNNNLDNLRLLCANCYCQFLMQDDDSSVELTPKVKKTKCKDCKSEISDGASRCIDCNGKQNRKTKRPSKEDLVKDKKELRFFTKIGTKYGVSDNAVRKWFKKYEIDLR